MELKRRYFNNDSIKMYLCTDGPLEEIRAKMGDIPILHYGELANNNTNYMTRVASYLKRIDTKYVIFWCDDMFLTGPVDWASFSDAHTLMEANPHVKLIKLSECSWPFGGRTIEAGSTLFQLATPRDAYIMNVQPTLFDRAFLPAAQEFLQKEGIDIELCDKNCIYDVREKSNTDTLNPHLKIELHEWFHISV
jgi:hypothetical protein